MAVHPKASFHGSTDIDDDASLLRIAQEAMGTIVIFGATGDLARRKLIPALFKLWKGGFLPERVAIVGVARRELSHEEFRGNAIDALCDHAGADEARAKKFAEHIHYYPLAFGESEGYAGLAEWLRERDTEWGLNGNRLFYLSTAPNFFATIVENLGRVGLTNHKGETWSRVVIEKPFGEDLETAQALNSQLLSVLSEEQIFRIDHYLGKETVQNILAFRFGNSIFEPIFNQQYIDHVQITVAETVSMEGRRGEFYDRTGAMRDVVQNHGLQLLSLVAMEPPATFSAQHIRDEKVKVLASTDLPTKEPLEDWLVRGQYSGSRDITGYASEVGVAENSVTETFVAQKLYIDNWRWAGVPFFIRTGKCLAERRTEIAVRFRHPPTHYFKTLGLPVPDANVLVFRIQPDEAIFLRFNAKPPGMAFKIQSVDMDFEYGETFQRGLPEAYERLLLDALRGDSTLFTRADEIEHAWSLVTRTREAWDNAPPPDLYRPGSWGPPSSDRLMQNCQGGWRNDTRDPE